MQTLTTKTAILGYKTRNIGDDLQSFSLLNVSPTVDAIVDRDCLADAYLATDHRIVLNTWFKLGNDNRSPNKRLKPIFYGFALGDEGILDTKLKDYLKAHEPIGCRDTWTVERLTDAGISAYWTACTSIFAGRFIEAVSKSRKGIYNVDVPSDFLRQYAPENVLSKLTSFSNHVPPAGQFDQLHRFSLVHRLLQRLSTAELVITRRLHIALPCIGLGTPVVYIPDERLSFSRRRASGVEKMIPIYFQSDVDSGLKIDWNPVPGTIHEDVLKAYEDLKTTLDASNSVNMKGETREFLRLKNLRFGNRPGRVYFSMPGLDRELRIDYSCDKYIETDVRTFPGISRFTAKILNEANGSFSRPSVGSLQKLII